jgi:(p)ppGpp synthase/HD superfamily hydrolase
LFLEQHGFDDIIVAAAFVHDVLEDTDVTPEQLRNELGNDVFEIVDAVSHDNALAWKEKKLGYIEKVRNGPDGAKAVCTADHIYNCENTIATYKKDGPALWEKFSRGRDDRVWFEEATLVMLRESWGHPLVDKYAEVVEELRSLV